MGRRAPIFWHTPYDCLDEAFDAPDDAADHELCRAIAAGRWGLHPDGWGNHEGFNRPASRYGEYLPSWTEPVYVPSPVDRKEQAEWVAQHRRRPVEPIPATLAWTRPAKPWKLPPDASGGTWAAETPSAGEIQMDCDDCRRRFGTTLTYKHGQREAFAAGLRALGAQKGWTHIDGRDRCPECSTIAAPNNVGQGTGERQRDEQHADGG